MIKIYFDTNIIQGQMYNDKYSLKDFSLNRNIDKVINLVKELEIEDITELIIPIIVLKEIRQHKIEEFIKQQEEFFKKCDEFKRIFGDCIKINKDYIITTEQFIKKLDKNIQIYRKEHSKDILFIDTKISLESIIDKVISRKPMFKCAKGENKSFTDAGFKDHIIYETILENIDNKGINILYTNDNDFNEVCDNVYLHKVENIEKLKNTILSKSNEAKLKQIIRELNSDDNVMNIKGYIVENSGNDINLDNSKVIIKHIIKESVVVDGENETLIFVVNAKIEDEIKKIEICFDYDNYVVINATLKK